MSLQDQINAAERAKQLLENTDLQDALTQIETAIKDQWADLSVESTAQAEKLKHMLWAARQFRAVFELTIQGGTVAKHELLADNIDIRNDARKGKLYGTT